MNLRKALFLVQWPPPVHGSSLVGQWLSESRILRDSFDCDFVNTMTSGRVSEIGAFGGRKVTRYLSLLLRVGFRLMTRRYDFCCFAITAQGVGFYKDALLAAFVKMSGVTIVYHFHNKGVRMRQDRFWDNLLYRTLFRGGSAILLSRRLYPDVERYFSKSSVHVCPYGVPEVRRPELSVNRARKNSARILYLGNMIRSKGVMVLLDACSILRQEALSFSCHFVGAWGDVTREQFEVYVEKNGLADCVFCDGPIYGEQKAVCLADANIFAFPTFYHFECFPLVNLEAMQYALPIVSTFEGAVPDAVSDGENGFLCRQQDSISLANALRMLILDSELREKMGRAGRDRYEREFTLEKYERRLAGILKAIAYGAARENSMAEV